MRARSCPFHQPPSGYAGFPVGVCAGRKRGHRPTAARLSRCGCPLAHCNDRVRQKLRSPSPGRPWKHEPVGGHRRLESRRYGPPVHGRSEPFKYADPSQGTCSRWSVVRGLGLCALLLLTNGTAVARDSFTRLKADEAIEFYPTLGQRVAGKDAWRLEIHGCVFELEKRGLTLAALREALDFKDVELTPAEQSIFDERARLFLVDHERGKRGFIRLGERILATGKSKADGHFAGEFLLSENEVRRLQGPAEGGNGFIQFTAELSAGDARRFAGEILLLNDSGLSVISDIDDTIKVTQVRDRSAMLSNTFLRPFEAAPGMSELYQRLARSNRAAFHYVSASPWQLYAPLAEFVRTSGFPDGTFALKKFRLKDRSFLSLLADPEKYKPAVIEPLLKRFPQRRFVLIGDSGERDPEVYAALARKYPEQIIRIWIRDVTDEPPTAGRYQAVFRGLPGELWQVFKSPRELSAFSDPLMGNP